MDNRQKEDKLFNSLKHPNENHSDEISKLIDKTIRSGNKVYLMTDWHLWMRKEKNKPECYQRSNFNEIINNMKVIKNDDLLIYMGDMVDGEFQDQESLKNVLLPMNFKKILVMGNNDLFSPVFYKSCGFDYVVQSFTWNNILFTHIPIRHSYDLAIHGHIHGYKTYWCPYNKHIDVAFLEGRTKPVELLSIIKAQPRYSKLIKECPEHFNEYVAINNKFDAVMYDYINMMKQVEDPFSD